MHPELDSFLCKKYPEMFADRYATMDRTAMCWGFGCGDGWFNIIDSLCSVIYGVVETANSRIEISDGGTGPVLVPKAAQVKEKFGGLRFYLGGVDIRVADAVYAAIHMAEEMASQTCDVCGNRGQLQGTGWISTRCSKHTKKTELGPYPQVATPNLVVGSKIDVLWQGGFIPVVVSEPLRNLGTVAKTSFGKQLVPVGTPVRFSFKNLGFITYFDGDPVPSCFSDNGKSTNLD